MAVEIQVGTEAHLYRSPTKDKKWKTLSIETKLAFVSACLKSCLNGENYARSDFENAGVSGSSQGWSRSTLYDDDFLEKMLNDDDLQKDLGKHWVKIFSNRTIFSKKTPLLAHTKLQKMASFYKWLDAVPVEVLTVTDNDGNDLLLSALNNKQYPEALAIIKKLSPEQLLHTNGKGFSAYYTALKADEPDIIAALEEKMPPSGFNATPPGQTSVIELIFDKDKLRALKMLESMSDKPDIFQGTPGVTLLNKALRAGDANFAEALLERMDQGTLWLVMRKANSSQFGAHMDKWLELIEEPNEQVYRECAAAACADLFMHNPPAFKRLTEKLGTDMLLQSDSPINKFLHTLITEYTFRPEDEAFFDAFDQKHFEAHLIFFQNFHDTNFAHYTLGRSSDEALGQTHYRGFTPLAILLDNSYIRDNKRLPKNFVGYAMIERMSADQLRIEGDEGETALKLAEGMRDKSAFQAIEKKASDKLIPVSVSTEARIQEIINNPKLELPELPSLEKAKEMIDAAILSGRTSDAQGVGNGLLQAVAMISNQGASLGLSNFEKSEQIREVIDTIQATLEDGHRAIEAARADPSRLLPATGLRKVAIDLFSGLIPGLDQTQTLMKTLGTMESSPQEVIDSCFEIIKMQEDIEEFFPELADSLLQLEEFLLEGIRDIEIAEAEAKDPLYKDRLPDLKLYFTDLASQIAIGRVNVMHMSQAARILVRSESKVVNAMNQARSAMTAVGTNTSATLAIACAKLAEGSRAETGDIIAHQLGDAARQLVNAANNLKREEAALLDAQKSVLSLPSPDQMGGNGVPLDLDDEDGEEESVLVPVGETGTAGDPTTQAAATGPA